MRPDLFQAASAAGSGPRRTFGVDVHGAPGTPVALVLSGEVDLSAAAAIAGAAAPLLAAAGDPADGRAVTVRLGQVTFLDCAALGSLVQLQTRMQAAGGDLVLADISAPARRVLTLTRRTHALLNDGKDWTG